MQPYSKIIGSQGPLGIIISLYSSAWHSEKLSLGMESGTCILKAGNYFNLQALVAFSGHWLALSLWHPHLDWELLPCAPATFPSTWHKTCQKKNLSCPLCLHLGLIPLPSPCLYSTREIQCNSTQQATLSSHQVTGRMPGASSTKKNKALFSGVPASGKERKRKQTMTYWVIITIERDAKHRKSKSHSVERN